MRGGRRILSLALLLGCCAAVPALAAEENGCNGHMRKINVGVGVTPPNAVHTSPYVAKALGFFAKRCIDVNIMQFEGGASASAVAAVAQGIAVSALSEAAIAEGIRAHQIWTWAVLAPQDYFVSPDIKTFADLKGRRLSAAGGVGALNWQMGREVLRRAGLTVNDVEWVSQGMAGRLPGLVTGQIDGVALHAEDAYLAQKQKPGLHSLISIAELLPNWVYGTYGAADSLIARDRGLVRDTIASLIEANRAIYTQRDKVIPIMVEATKKPLDSVEYAWDFLTKRCIWSVNTGFNKARSEWTMQYWIDVGDVPASKKLTFEQMDDVKLAQDALAEVGGPTTINGCKN